MWSVPKKAKIVLILLVAALLLMQVFEVERTNPPVQADISVEPDISPLLHNACYSCHSNVTQWPWYSHIAPASWLVVSDVNEGRRHLNFSEWGTHNAKTQYRKMEDIAQEVIEKSMPPWYYKAMHKEARLTEAERGQIWAWAVTESEKLVQ